MNRFRIPALCAMAMIALFWATGTAVAETGDQHDTLAMHATSHGSVADDSGGRHCPSDHPMNITIMTCCMAMVPDPIHDLYRHVAITVRPAPAARVHDRTIPPLLRPPQHTA